MSKKSRRFVLLAAATAVATFFGYQYWRSLQSALPTGIASGNGRVEAKLVDVASKEPLRVKEILVDEGTLVEPNQVIVRLDTATLESQLAEANANVAATEQRAAVTKSAIVRRKSEVDLSQVELDRAQKLFEKGGESKQNLDRRTTQVEVTKAALEEEESSLKTVMKQVEVAQANAATIQTRIDDATLKSPVRGRVLYRLTEVGEVLAPGGKALTLVNLEDVYMEIFLPSEEASSLKIGAEARITVDYAPGRAAAGYVSFVSPEAQFTPKQVETRSERDKLMFRVKIQLPDELVTSYIERIKTGVRGVGYVKVDESAVWPDSLQNLLAPPKKPDHTASRDKEELSGATQDAATTPENNSATETTQP